MSRRTKVWYVRKTDSPLGPIALASNGLALCGLWFEGQRHYMRGLYGPGETIVELDRGPMFDKTIAWLHEYFSGGRPEKTPQILFFGNQFEQRVWHLLTQIPYGETTTYGSIAKSLEKEDYPGAVSPRDVGTAVGLNPISLIVPCHRVIGSTGALVGYAGGLERKRFLLELEGIIQKRLFVLT